jgi:hypothetical protein
MANHHVATLSADKYDDVEAVVDRLRGALEKRFGVPTMVEAHYPRWSVSAELSSRDPAPAIAPGRSADRTPRTSRLGARPSSASAGSSPIKLTGRVAVVRWRSESGRSRGGSGWRPAPP